MSLKTSENSKNIFEAHLFLLSSKSFFRKDNIFIAKD
jgi:hypothetical protein